MYPSEIADEALRTITDLADPDELPTAMNYWGQSGDEIDALILRSKRHHGERDKMH